MRYFIILFIILFCITSYSQAGCIDCHGSVIKVNELLIKNAEKYLYVREATNNNDAPEIYTWNKYAKSFSKFDPYCTSFAVYNFHEVFDLYSLKNPVPKTAGVAALAQYASNHPFDFKVISTKKINWGVDNPQIGDIASFKHGTSTFTGWDYKGHTELVRSSDSKKNVFTIGANTKAGNGGDQSGTKKGDFTGGQEGVYYRTRTMGLSGNFPIMYFIRLQKRIYTL